MSGCVSPQSICFKGKLNHDQMTADPFHLPNVRESSRVHSTLGPTHPTIKQRTHRTYPQCFFQPERKLPRAPSKKPLPPTRSNGGRWKLLHGHTTMTPLVVGHRPTIWHGHVALKPTGWCIVGSIYHIIHQPPSKTIPHPLSMRHT